MSSAAAFCKRLSWHGWQELWAAAGDEADRPRPVLLLIPQEDLWPIAERAARLFLAGDDENGDGNGDEPAAAGGGGDDGIGGALPGGVIVQLVPPEEIDGGEPRRRALAAAAERAAKHRAGIAVLRCDRPSGGSAGRYRLTAGPALAPRERVAVNELAALLDD